MTFEYRLSSLLKLDRLEGEALGQEVRRAYKVLEEKVRLLERADAIVKDAEAALRDLYRQEQSIHLGKREVLHTFLRYQHAVAAACEKDAEQAHAVYEKILGQLEKKRLSIRTLEKHQERKRREHDVIERRAEANEADESWLRRRNGDA